MARLATFIKIKTLPGKREQVKQIWDKIVRPRVEGEDVVEHSFFCYEIEDDDTICLFEFFKDPSVFEAAMKSDWFLNYMEQLKPLLSGPPERNMTTPVWAKGTSI
jgi:quinol monooxygenase YgiN